MSIWLGSLVYVRVGCGRCRAGEDTSGPFKTAAGVRGLYYVIQFADGFMQSKVKPSFTVIHRSNGPAFHLWWSYPTDQPMNKSIGSKQISFGICFALLTFLFYIIIDDRLPWKFNKSGLTSSKEQHMFKPDHATSDSTTSTTTATTITSTTTPTTPTTSSLLPLNLTQFPQTLPLLSGTDNQPRVCSDYVIFSNGFKDGRRLGNQIFNYAVGFYVAELTGWRVGFNESGSRATRALTELEKVFQLNIDRYSETCPVCHITDAKSLAYNEKFEELVLNETVIGNKTIRLEGFFQSWKYTRLEDALRSRLMFKEDLLLFAKNFLRTNIPPGLNQGLFTRVGIHVRRGDIVEKPSAVAFGYTTPGTSYFKRAMQYMADMYTRVQFLVFTDDSKWAIEHITPNLVEKKDTLIRVNVTICKGNSAGQDLAILSLCDHTIMSTGTYGWWGAWLAKGTTIYYSNWPRNGSALYKMSERSDFFPPSWIGMGDWKERMRSAFVIPWYKTGSDRQGSIDHVVTFQHCRHVTRRLREHNNSAQLQEIWEELYQYPWFSFCLMLRLHDPTVGPTGRADRSGRPVGPTGRPDIWIVWTVVRPVGPTGRMNQTCQIHPTGRTNSCIV